MRPGRNGKIDDEKIDLIFNKEKAGTLHFIKNVPALPYCIGITRIIICMRKEEDGILLSASRMYIPSALYFPFSESSTIHITPNQKHKPDNPSLLPASSPTPYQCTPPMKLRNHILIIIPLRTDNLLHIAIHLRLSVSAKYPDGVTNT